MSKVSVIFPIKPPEPYFHRLIDEIIEQPYEKEFLFQYEEGLSYAVRCGVERANGTIIAVLDADGSHDPKELPAMIKLVEEGYDLVIGSRYVSNGNADMSFLRGFISKAYCKFTQVLLGLKVRDPMSGYVVGTKEPFTTLKHSSRSYKFVPELLMNAENFVEHPITLRERAMGESKANVAQGLITLGHLVNLWGLKHPKWYHFLKFSIVAFLFGYLGNLALVYVLERYLGIWWGYGMLIGALGIHIVKYLLNEFWTWKN